MVQKPDGTRRKEIIQKWFDSAVHDGGIDRCDHLHVDQIDADWKPRNKWISSGLQAFEMAMEIRDKYATDTPLTIVLTFELESDTRPLGITFHTRKALEKSLSDVPPSLYVFRTNNNEFLTKVRAAEEKGADFSGNIRILNGATFFGEMRKSVKCIYSESKRPDDDEYSRYLYVAG